MTVYEGKCPVCKAQLDSDAWTAQSGEIYCSKACSITDRNRRSVAIRKPMAPRKGKIRKICPAPDCGKDFEVYPSQAYVVCCSRACSNRHVKTGVPKAVNAARPVPRQTQTKVCPVCEDEFTVPLWDNRTYCSTKCSANSPTRRRPPSKKTQKVCPGCGNTFEVYPSQQHVRCCSHECAAAYRRGKDIEHVREMTEVEAAWLAGLFDGEGSVTLSRRDLPGGGSVRISIANTCKPLLDRVVEVTGISTMSFVPLSKKNPRHADQWTWYCSAGHAIGILRQMRPWMIVKADRTDAALAGRTFPRQSRWDDIYPPQPELTD